MHASPKALALGSKRTAPTQRDWVVAESFQVQQTS
jgi:hypothetical protein